MQALPVVVVILFVLLSSASGFVSAWGHILRYTQHAGISQKTTLYVPGSHGTSDYHAQAGLVHMTAPFRKELHHITAGRVSQVQARHAQDLRCVAAPARPTSSKGAVSKACIVPRKIRSSRVDAPGGTGTCGATGGTGLGRS